MEDTESKRISEIKELGVLCYNIIIDNGDLPQPIVDKAKMIESIITQKQNNGDSEDELQDNLIDIGCMCYNLYIDNKIVYKDLVDKCKIIEDLNKKIVTSTSASLKDEAGSGFFADNSMSHVGYRDFVKEQDKTNVDSNPETDSNLKHDEFIINQPYGMEPIPNGYHRCRCGYRNRAYANYCGKCGALLRSGG